MEPFAHSRAPLIYRSSIHPSISISNVMCRSLPHSFPTTEPSIFRRQCSSTFAFVRGPVIGHVTGLGLNSRSNSGYFPAGGPPSQPSDCNA
ncbi:hypothetical protein NP493_1334g00004 [Ridgeia piscesae]|uniref:Uncharacterized protein n=1 Tax=Ridgeia piscesae TaxID=27915 RepID=A0AAD9K833_RIDPI|nr:hypothetical protein NP493_1334g00004 [Ridgeia piscesae]